MEFSYWERKEWFSNVDITIVGSGIVGLTTALILSKKYPAAKIIILERGTLPQGASTKNAGFACFGSVSEILSDLNNHTQEEVYNLVKKRWDGLTLLRENLSDSGIDFQQNGSYELFLPDTALFDKCNQNLKTINELLKPIFKDDVFNVIKNPFGFKNIGKDTIFNQFEGQIDTGKMMSSLLSLVQSKGVKIINNCTLIGYSEDVSQVHLNTNVLDFSTSKLLITTNGFAAQLLNENVQPARAQVLITKPIKDLHIKGTFHLDEGYYYFRNIDNRILFGGGRNLDIKSEETTVMAQTSLIQNKLNDLLKKTILPNTHYEVDYSWSGIMGVGSQKKAIVKQVSNHIYCGVRLGGMGIAIGSLVGNELAELVTNEY